MRNNVVMAVVALWGVLALAVMTGCGQKQEGDTAQTEVSPAAPAEAIDPVCGFIVDPATAFAAEYEGETYYFCDPGCKAYFTEHAAEVAAGKPVDPVCGMEVDPAAAHRLDWEGRAIYFCAEGCRESFLADPEKYAFGWDPACQKSAPLAELPVRADYQGWPMTFCSEECRDAFLAAPEKYMFAECPVCGRTFPQSKAGSHVEHEGRTFYFCDEACREKFDKAPAECTGPYRGSRKAAM